jgi:hypothetical protein
VLSFIQKERLQWDTIIPSGDPPFSNPAEYRILYNDWPYHIDKNIKHLVVWTKFPINDDLITEDVTDSDRAYIEYFIQKTFCSSRTSASMSRDQVIWFRNWKSLKSVHALGAYCSLLSSDRELTRIQSTSTSCYLKLQQIC